MVKGTEAGAKEPGFIPQLSQLLTTYTLLSFVLLHAVSPENPNIPGSQFPYQEM